MTNQYSTPKKINPIEKPIHALIDLNIRTFQNLNYLTPVDLVSSLKPKELLEKNVDLMIQNSHLALDYMQDVFHIIEQNWLSLSDDVVSQSQEVQSNTRNLVNETANTGKRAVNTISNQLTGNLREMSHAVVNSERRKPSRTAATKKHGANKSTSHRSSGQPEKNKEVTNERSH